jgi:hypothetical protein
MNRAPGGCVRLPLTTVAALCLAAPAAAGVGGQVNVSTTLVPGLSAPAAEVPTLTGSASAPSVFDPRLRLGVSAAVQAPLPGGTVAWASWGVWRDQTFCDVCEDGQGPGWLGSELLGSTDATVAVQRRFWLGEPPKADPADDTDATVAALQPGRARTAIPWLILRADAVLPASRDALACNPMLGAPGAGAIFGLPAGASTVQVSVSGSRPVYRYAAAPVGRCAPPLQGDATVRTLTGEVQPTPWAGERWGAQNPTLSGNAALTWAQPHALIPGAPQRLFTTMSLGLAYSRVAPDPATTVDALTGAVAVREASNPVRTAIPWSVQAGWSVTPRLDLWTALSNRLPTLSADPGGTLRAQPAQTAITAALAARF